MKNFEPEDEDRGIDEYPGFLGLIWDGEFCPGEHLSVLKDFDWLEYSELSDEAGGTRRLELKALGVSVEFEPHGIASLLDQLPSVDAMFDDGPPDAGPASGSGYVFFLADGANVEAVERDCAHLRAALDSDLQILRSAEGNAE